MKKKFPFLIGKVLTFYYIDMPNGDKHFMFPFLIGKVLTQQEMKTEKKKLQECFHSL